MGVNLFQYKTKCYVFPVIHKNIFFNPLTIRAFLLKHAKISISSHKILVLWESLSNFALGNWVIGVGGSHSNHYPSTSVVIPL